MIALVATALTAGASPALAQQEDKALGRPAQASSVEMPRNGGGCNPSAGNPDPCAPANANDGDADTRWGSEYSDPQFWQVDLGRPRLVDGLSLLWHRAHSSHYLVSTSVDGSTFTPVANVTLRLSEADLQALSVSRRLRDEPTFAATTARYVRITSLERAPVIVGDQRLRFGVSLWEARVLGPSDDAGVVSPPPASVPPPTQTTSQAQVVPAAPAFDTAGSSTEAPSASVPLALMSPFPTVRLKGVLTDRGAAIDLLSVRAPRAAVVRVRCRGRGCPLEVRTRRGSVRRVVELQRELRAGAVVEVFVVQRGRYGKYTRFKIRKGLPPRRVDRCVAGRSSRPVRCPRA